MTFHLIERRQHHLTLHSAPSRARRGVARAGSRSPIPGTDWPMWGGTPDRNMVSSMKGLPTTWDVKTKKNVKWVAELGSQTYGNPVVAGGIRARRHQQRSDEGSRTSRGTRAS